MQRILLMENESRARQALKSILESAGYEVMVALGVDEPRGADLVIADGIDEVPSGIPVLAVPGGTEAHRALLSERLRSSGVCHFLPKPFRRDDLLVAVRASLE